MSRQCEPNQPVELDYLAAFGVLYFKVPLDDPATFLNALAAERQYKNRDEVRGAMLGPSRPQRPPGRRTDGGVGPAALQHRRRGRATWDAAPQLTVSPDKLPNYQAKIKTFFEEYVDPRVLGQR